MLSPGFPHVSTRAPEGPAPVHLEASLVRDSEQQQAPLYRPGWGFPLRSACSRVLAQTPPLS